MNTTYKEKRYGVLAFIFWFTVVTLKDMTPNPLHRHRHTETDITPNTITPNTCIILLPQCYPYTLCYPITPKLPYYLHVILIHCVTLLPQCYPYTLGVFTSTGVTGYTGIQGPFIVTNQKIYQVSPYFSKLNF